MENYFNSERFVRALVTAFIVLAIAFIAGIAIHDYASRPSMMSDYHSNLTVMTKDGASIEMRARIHLTHDDELTEDEMKWLFLYGVHLTMREVIKYDATEIMIGRKGFEINDAVCDSLRNINEHIIWVVTYCAKKSDINGLPIRYTDDDDNQSSSTSKASRNHSTYPEGYAPCVVGIMYRH